MINKIYANDLCPCNSGRKYKNCCGKVALNSDDFKDSFIECMNFMINSCYAYDNGMESEAKRIAVEIRKLIYQSDRSVAILHSLGKDNIRFFSSVESSMKDTDISWIGIAAYTIIVEQYTGDIKGVKVLPFFGKFSDKTKLKEFQIWWNEEVLVDSFKKSYSRYELVLLLANKDNGAHVDPELDKEYYETTRNCGIGMKVHVNGNVYEGKDTVNAIVRQIAHEIIFSFYEIEDFKYIKCIQDYIKRY